VHVCESEGKSNINSRDNHLCGLYWLLLQESPECSIHWPANRGPSVWG